MCACVCKREREREREREMEKCDYGDHTSVKDILRIAKSSFFIQSTPSFTADAISCQVL